MTAFANHAWTITLDGVRTACPDEVEKCETAFGRAGLDWDSFAWGMAEAGFDDLPEGLAREMTSAWDEVERAFKQATTVGKSELDLRIAYYSSGMASSCDGMNEGCFFIVERAVMLTPAAENLKEHLAEKRWVDY
jgi:hypothetical protein